MRYLRSTTRRVSLLFIAASFLFWTANANSAAQDSYPPVQITHGPVVESTTETMAVIAWSTNVNAGTLLRYGADPDHLDQSAGMPWGGITHRVDLRNLNPGTTYYFQAESAEGQGTGTSARSQVASFATKAAGAMDVLSELRAR
ncbi:MAG TPA: fibronectin type III domain-containing protein [Terriglobales bacterium]|nr:fibronectin type III domain-containing protein [Terriglobales bacterium]